MGVRLRGRAGLSLNRALGPGLAPRLGVAVALSTLSTADTLRTARTYHRERHAAAPAAIDVVTSFDAGGALRGSGGNPVPLERAPSKIAARRARHATAAERVSRRPAVPRRAAGGGT